MYRGLKKVYLKNDNLECIPTLQRHDDIIYVLPNNDMYTWNGTCRKWQLVSGEIGDDFANYYNKQEIDEKENNIYEEINNNKNECNEKYESLNNKLENNYYTKNEIDVKHDIINDELNSINNKFNNYYTQSEINTLLDEIGCKCDLSQFYTREEIDNKLTNIYDSFYYEFSNLTQNLENNYYTKNEIQQLIDDINNGEVDLTNYYTKSEINNLLDEIGCKCDLSQFYNKNEIDNKITTINNKFTNYYNKNEIDIRLTPLEYDSGWIELDVFIQSTGFFTNDTVKTKIRRIGKVVELRLYAKVKHEIPKYQEVSLIQIPSQFAPKHQFFTRNLGQPQTATIYNVLGIIQPSGYINLICPIANIQENAPIQLHETWLVD